MHEYLILIIEDEVDIATILKRMLIKRFPCRVEIAHNYAQALVQLSTIKPDLLFIDINLGDGNGYDLLEHIQPKNDLNSVVVMMSAYANEVDKVKDNPAIRFIAKPFHKQEVLDMVSGIINPNESD